MNKKMGKWKYQKALDIPSLLYSVVCWDLTAREQKLLSELFLSAFSRNNLVKEHLACQPWNVASLLLWPLLFPLSNNFHQKSGKERKRKLNSILSNVVKSWQLQEGFYREENWILWKMGYLNHCEFHLSVELCS